MDENIFRRAILENDLTLLKTIPKGDLHNHSPLGFKIHKLENYIGKKILNPSSIMSLNDFESYISNNLTYLFKNKQVFEYSMEQCILEAIEDGVSKLEMGTSIAHLKKYDCIQDFCTFLSTLRNRYAYLIDYKPEISLRREYGAVHYEKIIYDIIDSNTFYSIDLSGDEFSKSSSDFKKYYSYAQNKGMKLKAHVGEFSDYSKIIETVETLNLSVVQHGISASYSSEIMNWLSKNSIVLNICPSSNLKFNFSKNYEAYPIRKLFENDIKITVGSDDIMVFEKSISEIYLDLFNFGLFSVDELNKIRLNSLN